MKYIENGEEDEDAGDFMIDCYVDVYKVLSESFIKINLIDNMVQLSACMVNIYKIINSHKKV